MQRYRKKDPVSAEETEFMENVFDVLCSALAEPDIKKQFLESEGVDLMVLIMKYVMFERSFLSSPDLCAGKNCRLVHEPSRPSTTPCQVLLELLHATHLSRHSA